MSISKGLWWVVVVAAAAGPLWFLGYNVWYEIVAARQYAACKGFTLPTDLVALERKFGQPYVARPSGDGTIMVLFEPSPLYSRAFSTDITATTKPGDVKVIDLYCGEGW